MDRRVKQLFEIFVGTVEPLQIDYAIGGAIAMHAHGHTRETTDVDAFLLDEDRNTILRAIRSEKLKVSTVMEPFHYVAYLPEHNDLDYRIDLLFPAAEPELSAIEFPDRVSIEGLTANVFPIDLLVMSKFYSDRTKDELDIVMLYDRGLFDPNSVMRIIESIDSEGAKDFAKLIEKIKKPRLARPRPKKRTP